MANVWIPRQGEKVRKGERTARLIRADAITCVTTTIGTQVVVPDMVSRETVVVADWQDGVHAAGFPCHPTSTSR